MQAHCCLVLPVLTMASISNPLLAGSYVADGEKGTMMEKVDAASIAEPAFYRKCYFTVACLSLVSLGLLGLACVYSPLTSPRTPGTLLVNGWGDASCYTFTGGTCMVENCYAFRDAYCTSDHNCACANGCTGADGICHHNISSYNLVGKSVRFRNVKWSDNYLYAPRTFFMEQLRTAPFPEVGTYANLWNVYKVPGLDSQYHQEMFLLSPVEFPEFAAGVADTKLSAYIPSNGKSGVDNGGIVIPVGSMFTVSLYHLNLAICSQTGRHTTLLSS